MNKIQENNFLIDINRMVQALERIAKALESLGGEKERIVYCEHCKHWMNRHLCKKFSSHHGTIETTPDFFCGYAKRKE